MDQNNYMRTNIYCNKCGNQNTPGHLCHWDMGDPLDELVRDLTKIPPMPKSEVRQVLQALLDRQRVEIVAELEVVMDEYGYNFGFNEAIERIERKKYDTRRT